MNLYNGEIDGINGKGTNLQSRNFKISWFIIDGVLGPNTKAALEKGDDSYVLVIQLKQYNI